jgi:hypothetical protein
MQGNDKERGREMLVCRLGRDRGLLRNDYMTGGENKGGPKKT